MRWAAPRPSHVPCLDAVAASTLRRRPAFFLLAGMVSFVAHGVVAWSVYDRPIGRIDPRLLTVQPQVQRVRLVESERTPDLRVPALAEAERVAAKPLELKELGKALLESQAQSPQPAALPAVALRKAPDERGGGLSDSHLVELPEARMSRWVQQKLIGRLPLEVTYEPAPESGKTNGELGAAGRSRETALAAQALLARVGLQGAANPQPAAIQRPALIEFSAIDRRILNTPLSAPPIDFASLTLETTTRLEIPEHLDTDFDYAVSVYRPVQGPGYFRVDLTARRSLRKLRAISKDIVVVLDTSGSVPQQWVDAATAGVKDALASLNRGDRFNIVRFKDKPSFFHAETIQPFNETTLAAAHAFLEGAVSSGYTDVNQALSQLLVRDVAVKRVYYLVFVSDGRPTRGVMDTRELINRITRDNNLAASIYCIGVGGRQNEQLLDFLAYRNQGFCLFIRDVKQAAAAIRDLVSRLRYPILKDVRLNVIGVPQADVFPRTPANIHQSQQIEIFGRFDQRTIGPITIRMVASNHARSFDFTFQRDLRLAQEGPPHIAHAWAFQKLHHLYSEMLRAKDPQPIKMQIDRLRRRYKLKTLY